MQDGLGRGIMDFGGVGLGFAKPLRIVETAFTAPYTVFTTQALMKISA